MATQLNTSKSSICLTTVLYILQGMNIGLTNSIPLFLIYYGATWKDRGTFNFATYPFSMKLIWAPLIDVLYFDRFGKRKSWLVPIQVIITAILFLLSFYIDSLIVSNRVVLLTIVFFAIIFLTATEDICIDGLAISLFSITNPQWASTSQTVGQTFGRFLGSSFLMTFESANFTNQYIRKPLSLPTQTTGLFSLEQFICFVAISFLIVTLGLIVFVREKDESLIDDGSGEKKKDLSLRQTYFAIVKLMKKKCILQLTLIFILSPIGFVAIHAMTPLALISQGVSRENLALVSIPVTLATLVAPLTIRHTKIPMIWFARTYVLHLIHAIPIAIYVFYTPRFVSSSYYYPVLILILLVNEFIKTLQFAASVGFVAAITDPYIAGTYMTLLATLSNLGVALNSSAILYAANWFPKKYAYLIAVCICELLGILWFISSYRLVKRLQKLPTHKWHLFKQVTTPKEHDYMDHETSFISDKQIDN